MGIATDAVHAGQEPDPTNGAVITPLYATSTYVQGVQEGELGAVRYDYARTINPTREALEANIAALEGARFGLAFASGMAAIDTVVRTLSEGDHVICGANVYGGTFRLFDRVLSRQGLRFSYVDTSNLDALRAAMRPETKLVHVETPTNPVMTLTDIRAAAKIAHEGGARLVVDNTFMSPVFQRPLELDADVVVHSTTKFLNGHSDSVGGVAVTNDEDFAKTLHFLQNSIGGIMSPWDAWLVLRGTKTLVVRMREHDRSGREVAAFLDEHPKVSKVLYPGLPSHPQHDLAKSQMSGFGAMVSFIVGDTVDVARRFLRALRVCSLAESLGGVETLISHPASMTHASVPEAEREKLGIAPGLVRISVGIEDVADLIEDLRRGFDAI